MGAKSAICQPPGGHPYDTVLQSADAFFQRGHGIPQRFHGRIICLDREPGDPFWMITEADQRSTWILLQEDR